MNNLCDYGCNKEFKFILKNRKRCCSSSFYKCSGYITKIKESNKNRKNSRKYLEVKNSDHLCDYGCNKKANYYFPKSYKYCCSNSHNKCDNIRKINSIMNSKENHHMWGKNQRPDIIKKISDSHRFYLSDFKYKYPIFYKIEEPIEDSNRNILVRCKYCGIYFIPTHNQLWERIRQLESKTGNGKCFFYCCKEHRNLCPFFGYHRYPSESSEYKLYHKIVMRNTYITIINNHDKIKNLNLRSNEYHLDHKYSINEGFKNNIDPKIISHWKNLEIIKNNVNCSKSDNCSINLSDLLEEIKSVEEN